jgi:hypothetical protein
MKDVTQYLVRIIQYIVYVLYDFSFNKLLSLQYTGNLYDPYPVLAITIIISMFTLIVTCLFKIVFSQIRKMSYAICVACVGKR